MHNPKIFRDQTAYVTTTRTMQLDLSVKVSQVPTFYFLVYEKNFVFTCIRVNTGHPLARVDQLWQFRQVLVRNVKHVSS